MSLTMDLRDGALWLTFNRPRAANALDAPTQEALQAALARAGADAEVRAVVLAGAGDRVFSAGADLREVLDPDPRLATRRRGALLLATLLALLDLPRPLIACVRGKAVGGGCMIALLADEVIAAPGAEFSLPEVALGMPTPIGAAVVAARGPRGVVQRLVQAGERIAASEALALGLIDHVAEDPETAAQARAIALGALPSHAYGGTKNWINAGLRAALLEAAAHGARLREAKHDA